MKFAAVIPARYASTRLPGKALELIGEKPMIQHVYEQVLKSKSIDSVLIATDDDRIYHTCQSFGAAVFKSKKEHISGTDRIAEAAEALPADVIVNVQGDEPFIDPAAIDQICSLFSNEDCNIATLAMKIDSGEIARPEVVKAYVNGELAIDFSRKEKVINNSEIHKHLGIYAFKKAHLLQLVKLPPSQRELEEKLEQLRWLDNGMDIHIALTNKQNIAVDTLEDLERARAFYRKIS